MKLYYKATLAGGVSGYDRNFHYKIGMNIHPSPDKEDTDSCGVGIHLAKSVAIAMKFVPKATELYLAEPGVILGEDDEKVRCASCNIVKKLRKSEIDSGLKNSRTIEQNKRALLEAENRLKKQLGSHLVKTGGLCGRDWLMEHKDDVTQEDIDNCRLEITTPHGHVRIGLSMKKKDREYVLKGALA